MTAFGASKVFTLSTLGAVSVSPIADLALTPENVASISTGYLDQHSLSQATACRCVLCGDCIDAREREVAVCVSAGLKVTGINVAS